MVFAERGKGENSYGALTINLDQPQNPIYCHVTGTRGNLLTLIHGFKHHRPPVSGKLRGDEFKEAARLLQEIAGKVDAVKLGWSNAMFGGAFAGREPESLTFEECDVIRKHAGE